MSSPSKKIHKWTEAQRTVLNLLNTQFDWDIDIRTQIFNIVSKDNLDQAGIHEGLSSGQLKSQWRDRMHKGREHLWRSALRAPRSDAERAERDGLVGRIHDAAATLGLSTEGEATGQSGDGDDGEQNGGEQELVDQPMSRRARNAPRKLAMHGRSTSFGEKTPTAGENFPVYGYREGSYAVADTMPPAWYVDEEGAGSADEEESTEAGEEVDDADEVDMSIREPKAMAPKPDEKVLEMLHHKDISWNADGASMHSLEGATIAHTSSYYKHGGEVRRISVGPDDSEADFMICDASICPACSDPSTSVVLAPAEELPFVHSSDTTIIARWTYFTPQQKSRPQGKSTKNFLRFVHFKGLDGDVAC